MHKLTLLIIFSILSSCNLKKEKAKLSKQQISDSIQLISKSKVDKFKVDTVLSETIELFDLNNEFEILTVKKSNNYPSSENDTSDCLNWNLNKKIIKSIIVESKTINGPEWHHLFGHLPCKIEGQLRQGNNNYAYSLNSGAWFSISSPDTTLLFGSFKNENDQYFLGTVWREEEDGNKNQGTVNSYLKNLEFAGDLFLDKKKIPDSVLLKLVPKNHDEFELYYQTTYPGHPLSKMSFFYKTSQWIFEKVVVQKKESFYLPSLRLISFADGEFAEEFIEYLELIIEMDSDKFCLSVKNKEYVKHNPIKYYWDLKECK